MHVATQLLVVKTWLACRLRGPHPQHSFGTQRDNPHHSGCGPADGECRDLAAIFCSRLIPSRRTESHRRHLLLGQVRQSTLGSTRFGFIEKTEHPERFLQAFFSLTTAATLQASLIHFVIRERLSKP